MADDDFNLNDVLPLLISRQRQQEAERASAALPGAVAKTVGQTVAPNLYDLFTQPRPSPGAPVPNAQGKVPSQSGMDPRYISALRDVGMLGAGGAVGRLAAPLAGEAAGLAGRVAPSFEATGALRAISGAAGLMPDEAEAARLSPERRQAIEYAKQKAAAESAAKSQAITGQAEAEAKAAAIKAQSEREQERQAQMAAALKAKQERETPFREAHPFITKALPFAGVAASALVPAGLGTAGRSKLQSFVNDWREAADTASKAVTGKSKGAATLAVNKLKDFEEKWPEMQARYKPGIGQTAAAAGLPAEGVLLPTEYDALTQDPNSPSKPTLQDWKDAATRAAIVGGIGGTTAAKLGSSLGTPVRPYVGGPGIIRSYEQRYPLTRAQQNALLLSQQLKQIPKNKSGQ